MADDARSVEGQMRVFGTTGAAPASAPVRVTLYDESFSLATPGAPPLIGAYRDVTALIAQPGALLLVLGDGDEATRVSLEGFGERQGGIPGLRKRSDRHLSAASGSSNMSQSPTNPSDHEQGAGG